MDCDGYTEFRVKFKIFLNEQKNQNPKADVEELQHYFKSMDTPSQEKQLEEAAGMIRRARRMIFVGIGTSGILGKYGALCL